MKVVLNKHPGKKVRKGKPDSTLRESFLASEVRYRRLFESAKDGILIMDAETGKIIDVNPFLIELTGYPKESFIEKKIWEIGFLRDIAADKEKLLELQFNELVRYDNLPLETADGRKISVEFVCNVYYENKTKMILCNIRDITERKLSENALILSENRLRKLVQTIPDLIWLKDINGIYLSCNQMFGRFFGALEADIVGKSDYDFVDKELADFFVANDRKVMETGKPTINEEWITFADDGHRAYLETNKAPMYDAQNKLIGILGIGRDISDRKKAEDELLGSELKYRAFFENSMDAILLTSPDGRTLSANRAACIMFGYSEDELIRLGRSGVEDATDPRLSILLEERQLKGNARGEVTLIRKDGTHFPAEISSAEFKNHDGSERNSIIIHDITIRKNAEKALSQSEEKFRSYFDNAPDGVFVVDETGTYIDVNESACKVSGYSRSELLKMTIAEILSDESLEEGLSQFKKLIESGTSKADLSFKHKDGSVGWWSFDGVKLTETRFLGFTKDITERKLAEKEITMLAHSLKSVNECVSITDLDSKILFVNESFLITYGYDINELIGKHINIIRSQNNDQQHIQEIIPATIRGEWQGELLNRRKDGTEFRVYLSTSVIRDKESKVLGLIGVAADITERKLAEKQLIEAKERAEESDRLKSAFLANMSHEIRTPMNGILGFTELLKEPMLSGEQKHEYINFIEKSGARMLNVINDIVSISKVESGQMEISISNTNVNEQIEYIFNFFNPEAEQKKLQFSYKNTLLSKEAIIRTDREKVFSVITNLVNNAIKFTTSGSIELGYEKKGSYLEFFVKDTGIGVPQAQQELIFERFRQGSESMNRNYEGAGLGLSISKAYIDMLGGKIWVVSDPDRLTSEGLPVKKGSGFYFTIPYNPIYEVNISGTIVTTDNETEVRNRNLKILIAEDDKISKVLVEIAARKISNVVLVVSNGTDAVEACRNNPDIDLVLMDIKMPEMDGYEATRQIRKFNDSVIIIAQTAYANDGEITRAKTAGCNDFITKPFNQTLLFELIKKQFNN